MVAGYRRRCTVVFYNEEEEKEEEGRHVRLQALQSSLKGDNEINKQYIDGGRIISVYLCGC